MELLYFSLFGIYTGFLFLIFLFFRIISNFNIVITIFLDFIWGSIACLLFAIPLVKYSYGNFKLFQLLCFLCGIILAIISLEKLVATIGTFVYNKVILNLKNKIIIFLKGRKLLWKRKNLQK